MEVRWTEAAKYTLQKTSDFIIELWNQQVHEDFVDQLEYRISQLRNNPELGPKYENTHFRKLVIHKNISLFYAIHPNYLKLLVLWDNRSDPDQLLEQLKDAGN